MTLRFAANLSLLWASSPLAERFARAADAGFSAVEMWWPGDAAARQLPDLVSRSGLRLALLNFDAGDMAAGDRGLAADPAQAGRLRANVTMTLPIARDCGCQRLNLLVGLRQGNQPLVDQIRLARQHVAWAADRAATIGASVMIEAVNTAENGPYLLTTTAAAAQFIRAVDRPNVRLQYDAYHMQRMEGNLATTIDAHWPLIGHIQIADCPGRNEPGTGEINYAFLLDHIDRKGYQGYIGLEYRPSTGDADKSFGWLDAMGLARGGRSPSPGVAQAGTPPDPPGAS
ncbi:MAG: hydroxypyruvate isomerase [Micromonosporaceae bacterium]